jgi:predicted nucleic acid-binding Zn ribbon protein
MAQAMEQFLKKSKMRFNIQTYKIEEIWETLMGKTIAKYTDSIKLINNTLFISTNTAPLKKELIFQRETIIKRINEALGENIIKEVVIK